jgi:hypothetical protein
MGQFDLSKVAAMTRKVFAGMAACYSVVVLESAAWV